MFCRKRWSRPNNQHAIFRATTCALKAHLGERLRQHHIVTLLDKVPDSKRIIVDISRCEPLVGHVKEWEMLLLLDNVGELLPLLRVDVDAGRVVSAGVKAMEQEDHAG